MGILEDAASQRTATEDRKMADMALLKAERDIEQLIGERDDAQEAMSQAYYLVTGRSPEWSNKFGYEQALEDIADAMSVLKRAARDSNN